MVTQSEKHLMSKFNNQEPRSFKDTNKATKTQVPSGSSPVSPRDQEQITNPLDYNTNPDKSCNSMELDYSTTQDNVLTTLISESNPPKLKDTSPQKIKNITSESMSKLLPTKTLEAINSTSQVDQDLIMSDINITPPHHSLNTISRISKETTLHTKKHQPTEWERRTPWQDSQQAATTCGTKGTGETMPHSHG